MSHDLFRKLITDFLESNYISTQYGFIENGKITINAGYPGGSHMPTDCWLFKTFSNNLVMAFGFYSNFTENDFICKVGILDEITEMGIGASIQFDAENSIRAVTENTYQLIHSGRVTVQHGIPRAKLSSFIIQHFPDIANQFQIIDIKSWPLEIGTTSDIPKFIDRLFSYTYAIEQVKRSIRGERPLINFDSVESEKKNVQYHENKKQKESGQGFSTDSFTNKLIEEYAMKKAIEFYEKEGFDVDDVSARESFDLLCKKEGTQLFVEVKGSSGKAISIIMTSNEIDKAKNSSPNYDLFVVDNIKVNNIDVRSASYCSDGQCKRIEKWRPDDKKCIPINFRVLL